MQRIIAYGKIEKRKRKGPAYNNEKKSKLTAEN